MHNITKIKIYFSWLTCRLKIHFRDIGKANKSNLFNHTTLRWLTTASL